MRNQLVALGIGSNLGRPIENLRRALSELKKNSHFKVLKVSRLYESDAQLPENSDPDWQRHFLNAAVLCECSLDLSAEAILFEIKGIEKKMGRLESLIWAPRLIDIDVLYWNQGHYQSKNIHVPHARLQERPFALLPLMDVWPEKPDLKMPAWVEAWVSPKPFNTVCSLRYFWPEFVGILNVTADSFSDGGKYLSVDGLRAQAQLLITAGASIIDVGAESTRPGAKPISAEAEFSGLDRALTAINDLGLEVLISVDCRNAAVAERIVDSHKVDFLNDVSGFSTPGMKSLLNASKKKAFVMHSLGIPPRAELTLNVGSNPCAQLTEWWQERLGELSELGIEKEKIYFDPGIGFGKTKLQNHYILTHLAELSAISNGIMLGYSRKSFLSLFSDRRAADRDLETAVITQKINLAYVQFLRVHDIEAQKIALKVMAAQ